MTGIIASMVGASFAPAVVNTAVSFDGTGDYYEKTSITSSASAATKFVVAFTYNTNTISGQTHLVNMYSTSNTTYGFYIWINSGRSQLVVTEGTTGSEMYNVYTGTSTVTTGAWEQIVWYFDMASFANTKCYKNGTSQGLTQASFNGTKSLNFNSVSVLKIGQKNTSQTSTGSDFNGKLSQVYIHNVANDPGIESFWDFVNSKPKDLGTNGTASGLPQPYVYHYGNSTTFATNNGTGFASYSLTANGNVTSATGPTYSTAPTFRSDSNSGSLKLAVPFDSYFGTTDTAYLISGSGLTTSASRTQGSNVTISSSQVKWTSPAYTKSADFVPGGAALTYTLPSSIPSAASGTFVIEGWFRSEASGTKWCLSSADSGGRWIVSVSNAAVSNLTTSEGNQNFIYIGTAWTHVAFVCDGGNKRCYYDGIYKGAWVSGNTGFSTLHIGQFNASDANDYDGQIQDLRVYIGTNNGYTGTNTSSANFTVPSSIIQSY